MIASRAALEFAERCKSATGAEEVGSMLYQGLSALGFAYVACSSHVDPLNPPMRAVSMCNYPIAWQQRFSEEDYALIDPVFRAARSTGMPFTWREMEVRGQLSSKDRRILAEASECGVKGGITLPLNSPGAMAASCSLVPGVDDVDPVTTPAVFMMALYAHETVLAQHAGGVRPKAPRLAPRERDCLKLIGIGKSDNVAGEILGISGRTVHNLIERAKAKYGVASRVQLAIKALFDGQLKLEDLDV